jgi:hypothetical protein
MGPNYNIHNVNDDEYYYCPNNDCACNGSSNHRGNDYYGTNDYDYDKHNLAASGDYEHHCCGHCGAFYNAYDEPICNDCGAPTNFSDSYNYFKSLFPDTPDDLAEHYDYIFGSYNDGDDFHPAYRAAYDDYRATKRRNTR